MVGMLTDNLKSHNKLDTQNLAKIMKIVEIEEEVLSDDYKIENLQIIYNRLDEKKR